MIEYPADFVPETDNKGFGVAFDIGTTTVVGILRDLKSGRQIGIKARTNPQNEYGMDVISRITFCSQSEGNLEILKNKIDDVLNQLIDELSTESDISKDEILSVAVCGNTTMSHIFSGYSPISLAHAPFTPAYTGVVTLTKEESSLDVSDDAMITVLPGIAGHVGGDITSGIVATRLLSKKGLTLFIDIGTNGEIVLTDGSVSYACSTAAGPAFEGASIEYGMRATHGAIEKVEIKDGEVYFKTIDSCEPVGICGSGLIDIVSEMIECGLIDKTGRLINAEKAGEKGIHEGLIPRLIEVDNQRQFILVYKENGENIIITQNDIREVQLAKGAIAAGTEILLKSVGKKIDDIESIIVAGAFGNYIDKSSAKTIGLLPDVDLNKIVFAGNAAGSGVSMTLASINEMKSAEEVPDKVKHIELAGRDDFQSIYLSSMGFRKK